MKNLVWTLVGLMVVAGTIGFAGLAQTDETQTKSTIGFVFGLGGRRTVEPDTVATGILTFGTDVAINGTVAGDVIMIGGDLTVGGTVEEDIVVIGGDVRLLYGAVVAWLRQLWVNTNQQSL